MVPSSMSSNVEAEKKQFGLRLSIALMRDVKHLGIDLGRRTNDLVEEGIRELLKKHQRKGRKEQLSPHA